MKFKLTNFIYFYFFCINFGNLYSMWKETYDYQQNSNDLENDIFYSYSNNDCNNNINFQMKLGFDPEETKKINLGEVQSELIYNEKVYTFYFNSFNHNKENDFLIHFYPLDCNIKIISQKENDANEIEFEKISNYEYNAFYAIIKKDKINFYIIFNFCLK